MTPLLRVSPTLQATPPLIKRPHTPRDRTLTRFHLHPLSTSRWLRVMATSFYKPMALAGLILVVGLSLVCLPSSAELMRLDHPIKSDGSLSLLVLGDWGRKGEFNQSQVAVQMGKIGEELDIDFIISTGDNFYEDGLTGTDDKAFEESFTNIYTSKSLQKQWYSVLGNHDYRGDVLAQLDPVLRKIDSRWLCMRSFILDAEIVQFFFVDTTPFVLKYWDEPEDSHYDWRDVAPRDTYIKNLLEDLNSALKGSTATWKFVVGHHTIRSVSEHGDTQELLQLLLPVLEDNGVDLYINGHDHCLEHISSNDSPIQYLTSGGGSKAWRGVYTPNSDKLLFFFDGQGFMSLQLTNVDAKAVFYDAFGKVLHTWSTTKDLRSLIAPWRSPAPKGVAPTPQAHAPLPVGPSIPGLSSGTKYQFSLSLSLSLSLSYLYII